MFFEPRNALSSTLLTFIFRSLPPQCESPPWSGRRDHTPARRSAGRSSRSAPATPPGPAPTSTSAIAAELPVPVRPQEIFSADAGLGADCSQGRAFDSAVIGHGQRRLAAVGV